MGCSGKARKRCFLPMQDLSRSLLRRAQTGSGFFLVFGTGRFKTCPDILQCCLPPLRRQFRQPILPDD